MVIFAFAGLNSQVGYATVIPITHFSVNKDTFAFYKDTECVQGHAILMPVSGVYMNPD